MKRNRKANKNETINSDCGKLTGFLHKMRDTHDIYKNLIKTEEIKINVPNK